MAEETTPEPQPTSPTPETPPIPEPENKGTDWKAEARKWEQRAKENSDAAARLSEIEDAKKTAEEKAAEKAAQAETRAQEAEMRALRLEVAAEKGLTPAQARRLVGADRTEMEADADDLLASFQPEEPAEPARARPREVLRPGAAPAADPNSLNGDPLLRDLKAKLGIS